MNRLIVRFALAISAFGVMAAAPLGRSVRATSGLSSAGPGVWQGDCANFLPLAPSTQSAPTEGGSFNFTINTGPGGGSCMYTVQSMDSWITGASIPLAPNSTTLTGDSELSYNVLPNQGVMRTGTILVSPFPLGSAPTLSLTVSQDGVCFEINPAGKRFPAIGGSGGFDATPLTVCGSPTPQPTVSDTWITIVSVAGRENEQRAPQSAPLASTISYSVAPNSGPERSGFIALNQGQPGSANFNVTQDASDECTPSSISFSPPSAGFDCCDLLSQMVTVTIPQSCGTWTPVANEGWIHTGGSPFGSGPGPDTLSFGLDDNSDGGFRSGSINVRGKSFYIYQNPGDCVVGLVCRLFTLDCSYQTTAGLIGVSHSFRDNILARSTRGRQYTRLYYQFSREAVRIVLSNPMLLLSSRDMLTRFKPVLESMVKGEHVNLSRTDLDDIDKFLTAFSEKGSTELRQALSGLRQDLRDPAVHAEFNISIVEGPKPEAAASTLPQLPMLPACLWMFLDTFGLTRGGFGRRPRARPAPKSLSFVRRLKTAFRFVLGKPGKPLVPMVVVTALVSCLVAPFPAHGISNKAKASDAPAAVSFMTYLGGSADDQGTAIATDSQGNTYVAGLTNSSDFPVSAAFQPKFGGGQQDAFVTKLSPAGTPIYSTYLGGAGQDNATGVAVDASGNAYVAGFTSSIDFPMKNPVQASLKAPVNAFVAKLDPAGSIVYSTYLGGAVGDVATSIAIDSSGSAYVAGVTNSPDFPVAGAAQASLGGASNAFVTKLSADGSRLVYSTYLGGGDTDGASGIAVDTTGEAYVTGVTSSRDFPTVSAFQPRHGGGFFDAFVAKLNAAGDHVLYSTYLGGGGEDRGLRIAADSAGNAYVTGDTDSTDFPTVSPFQSANQGGGSDAFVAKLNSAGSALVYSTYLGGSKLDGGTAIAVDSSGFAYVTGFTASSDFPVTAPTQQAYGGGAFDAFVAVLNPTGSGAIYSSYLGGSGIDSGFAVASNPQGGLCVMGQTDSKDLPVFNAFQPSYGGDPSDVFVARIKIGPVITSARVSGKSLLVLGIGFDSGATILLNGNPQKTARDAQNPSTALIGRKAGKLIKPGHTVTLQVKDADGILSNQFSFTRPTS